MFAATIIFFLLAIAAAFLGFGEIATSLTGPAQIAFVVLIVLSLSSLFLGARGAGDRVAE